MIVLAMVSAACGGGHRQLVTPGQVVVLGATTLRTQEGNVIAVVAERALDGHAANGNATLHGMTLDAAKRSPLVRVAAGRAWLAVQQTLGDPARAYAAARRGLDELGLEYRNAKRGGRHLIDDTGMTVLLAERVAAEGDVASAATMLAGVLQTRIDLYTRVFASTVK